MILASKSKVRKQILDDNNISTEVQNSNLDEDLVKESLLKEKASPELISKNLAELKANKVSQKNKGFLVIGCLLYTSPSPRDSSPSRMPSSA